MTVVSESPQPGWVADGHRAGTVYVGGGIGGVGRQRPGPGGQWEGANNPGSGPLDVKELGKTEMCTERIVQRHLY